MSKCTPRTCELCGTPFFTSPGLIAAGWGRFCSRDCGYKGRSGGIEARFWRNVRRTDYCWEWTASTDRGGYGSISENNKSRGAHQVSWEIHFGPIPDGMFVLHKCDNPPCVRPDHLFLGTSKDNAQDRQQKGRWKGGVTSETAARGESNAKCKLTAAIVIRIRLRHASGDSPTDMALEYDVNRSTIHAIVKRRIWTHI